MTEHWRGKSENEEDDDERRMRYAQRVPAKQAAILASLWEMHKKINIFQDQLTLQIRLINFLLGIIAIRMLLTY